MAKKEGKKHLGFETDAEILEKLESIAKSHRRSKTQTVIYLIEQEYERIKK